VYHIFLQSKSVPSIYKAIYFLDVQVTVHRDKFLKYNHVGALISQIYFWDKTLQVSDSSSVHHQQFFTVHTAMVYVIQLTLHSVHQYNIFYS